MTKVVKLTFNIIIEDVEKENTREEIIEMARQELIEIACTQGIEGNVISIKDDD